MENFRTSQRGTKRKRGGETNLITKSRRDVEVMDDDESTSYQEDDSDESEFKGFGASSEDDGVTESSSKPPPVPAGKYIPPAARKGMAQVSSAGEDPRLRKQVQGLFNRYDIIYPILR